VSWTGPIVTIAPTVHELIEPMVINFNQADTDAAKLEDSATSGGPSANQMVAFAGDQTITFASDPMVTELLRKLNETPEVFTANKPRALRNAAAARNELRRNIRGIIKTTDVKIPLRDGSYVCADVFRPADDDQYPVVMSQGFYGKSFDHGCICSEEDAARKEEIEDRYWHSDPTKDRGSPNMLVEIIANTHFLAYHDFRVFSPCSINFQNSRVLPSCWSSETGSLLRNKKSRNVFLCRTRWMVIPSGVCAK